MDWRRRAPWRSRTPESRGAGCDSDVKASRSPAIAIASSPCEQSRSSAPLCPSRWWSRDTSTHTRGRTRFRSSPPWPAEKPTSALPPPELKMSPPRTTFSAHLDFAQHPGGLHPTGHVDAVAPDVVLGFLGADHPGDHRPVVDPWHEGADHTSPSAQRPRKPACSDRSHQSAAGSRWRSACWWRRASPPAQRRIPPWCRCACTACRVPEGHAETSPTRAPVINDTFAMPKCDGWEWIYCPNTGWKVGNYDINAAWNPKGRSTWAQSGPGATLRPVAAM